MSNLFGNVGPLLKQAGWDVIPLLEAEKRPVEDDWQRGFDLAQITKFAGNGYAKGNTGLLSREFPGVDGDIRDPECSAAVLKAWQGTFGHTGPIRYGARPKWLLPHRLKGEPFAKRKVIMVGPDGKVGALEFLADGQQYVLLGRHPDGFDYTWENGEPGDGLDGMRPDDLPELSLADVEHFIKDILPGVLPTGWKILSEVGSREGRPLKDPREKRGLIGAFHRVFTVETVIERWLPGAFIFTNNSDTRLTYLESDSGLTGGAVVLPGRLHVFNSHNSDPCLGRAANLFDLVRVHKFGWLDDGLPEEDTFDITSLPSYHAMMKLVGALVEVRREMVAVPAVKKSKHGAATDLAALRDKKEDGPPVLPPSDAMVVARRVLANRFSLKSHDGSILQRHNGNWYLWTGTHYEDKDDEAIKERIWNYLDRVLKPARQAGDPPVRFAPNTNVVGNVVAALAALTHQNEDITPVWLKGWEGPAPGDVIALKNGLLHVPSLTLLGHTPGFFGLNALPFDYEPDAQCAEWLKFLGDIWGDDPESIACLQEIFGYLIGADTYFQKMFLFIGPKRSGKGTIGRILGALVGNENACGPTMGSLATQFGLAPLIGKLIALIPDARASSRDTQIIVERLLMISGEDAVSVDRKNQDAWNGKLSTRVVMMSNEMLSLGDSSSALVGRLIVLQMLKSFYGKEDTGLTKRLLTELPGIFNWALVGRARLYERGHFVQPKSSEEAVHEMERMNSPISEFLDDCCEMGADLTASKREVFEAWRIWCISKGRPPGNDAIFAKSLFAAATHIRASRLRNGGQRLQAYLGLELRPKIKARVGEGNFGLDEEWD